MFEGMVSHFTRGIGKGTGGPTKEVGGKVVVVTGGSMGMGRLMAERFARDGARVVLWSRSEKAEQAASDMRARGWDVHAYRVDVSDRQAVYRTAELVRSEVGRVNVVVNNAGVVHGGLFLDVSDEDHLAMMDVNFNGIMWVTRAFLPDMLKHNEGHFINMASAAAITTMPYMTTYCTSKAAVVHFTDCLRAEVRALGKTGVRFTIVCPSFVKTGMFDGAKKPLFTPFLDPEEMADKTYRAYQANKYYLAEPFVVKFMPLLRARLPRKLQDMSQGPLGIRRSMKNWTGHEK